MLISACDKVQPPAEPPLPATQTSLSPTNVNKTYTSLTDSVTTHANAETAVAESPETLTAETDGAANNAKQTGDANPISFTGFGPAKFGSSEEAVRMSWGRPLVAIEPADGSTCYYLNRNPLPQGHRGIAFMMDHDKFVRYDVDDTTQVAPGNIVVGDTLEKVLEAHAGHVENQAHKYIEGGHILIVTPIRSPGVKNNARLIFETDANNIIKSWRIGVAPQVYYVEGCG